MALPVVAATLVLVVELADVAAAAALLVVLAGALLDAALLVAAPLADPALDDGVLDEAVLAGALVLADEALEELLAALAAEVEVDAAPLPLHAARSATLPARPL